MRFITSFTENTEQDLTIKYICDQESVVLNCVINIIILIISYIIRRNL